MKALILTSDRPRHRYFAAAVAGRFDVPVVLSERKRNYYVQQQQSAQVQQHFDRIARTELDWFVLPASAPQPAWREMPDINDPDCVRWAAAERFDLVCLYGTGILGDGWLAAFPDRIVNLHLGLSPHYRGSATLFWPFFHRELHLLGTTIHLASARVDAGNILERVLPDLLEHEDYYAITNRLIRDSIDRFPGVADDYLAGRIVAAPQEKLAGRFCRKADFSEAALQDVLSFSAGGLSAAQIADVRRRRP